MNEAGLVANLLWLSESEYPDWNGDEPAMSISLWAQYVLDNFATVAEAVEHIREEEFVVVTDHVPGQDRLATLHLSLSDASGDSAVLEYVDGELVIHHDREYRVMTNSPTFEKQLALAEYWAEVGGTVMLPGRTGRPTGSYGPVSTSTRFREPRIAGRRPPASSASSGTSRFRTGSVRPTSHTSPRRAGGRSRTTTTSSTTSSRR